MSWNEYLDLLVKAGTAFALMLGWSVFIYPLARRRKWGWPRLLAWSAFLTIVLAAAKEWLDTVSPVYDQILSYGLGLFFAAAGLSYVFMRKNRPLQKTTEIFRPGRVPLRHLLYVGIELEMEGEKLYRSLASRTGSSADRRLCLSLAEDECQHALWLAQFTYRWLPRPLREKERAALRRWASEYKIFADPPEEALSTEALFQYALKQEQAFVDFYDSFSLAYPSCWQQLKLARVIEEERSHIGLLKERFTL